MAWRNIETPDFVPAISPEQIVGLIGRDSIEPGPHRPTRLKLPALAMKLHECGLKRILSEMAVAEILEQVVENLALVAMHEFLERPAIAVGHIAD
jgi:hypothetical protein